MPRQTKWGFPTREVLLERVQAILEQYSGTMLNIRQLYYLLVSEATFPNRVRSYKNLVQALTDWRRDGTLDVDSFEDLTRTMHHYDVGERTDDPMGWAFYFLNHAIESAEDYGLATWFGQENRVIVLVEKQAQETNFKAVCQRLDVDLAVMRGYSSLSYLKEIADSMEGDETDGRQLVLLYFGDFDPSGVNIPETIERDLKGLFNQDFIFERIALNKDQALKMKLIPAPPKGSDSRSDNFRGEHGNKTYELDAIEPRTLQRLISDAVLRYFDSDKSDEKDELEEDGKKEIAKLIKKHKLKELLDKMNAERKAGYTPKHTGEDEEDG